MIRAIGAVFTFVTLSMFMVAFGIGAIFFVYGRDLPSTAELASYQPKTISRIYSTEGQIIDEFAQERRLFAPASDIPPMVKAAFISAEDKSFYTHSGYDPRGMVAALRDAVMSRGQNLRGASTITQQVMKNFLLDGSRTGERKIKELILATRIEKTLDKESILELYLNEIFLGQNSYGVAAAAQTYFNKALRDLTPEEAAYLAVLPKAPSSYHPVRQMDRAVARRNFVLKEMFENGYLDEAAYRTAAAQPLRTVQSGDYDSFRASLPPRDYPTDEIRRQLSENYGEAQFFTGGYSVRSTIEPDLQLIAAQALRAGLEKYDRNLGVWRGTGKTIAEDGLGDWQANLSKIDVPRDITTDSPWFPAVVLGFEGGNATLGIEGIADPGTIRADALDWTRKSLGDDETGPKAKTAKDLVAVGDVVLVQNTAKEDEDADWRLRQVPQIQGGFMAMDVDTGRVLAMQGGFSYQHSVFNRATQARRQPGSSFKPFVYAAALDSGYSPATIVIDAPIEVKTGEGIWRPKNASNKFYGPTPVRTGIELSRNLMTIRLAQEVTMETVARYAEKFGVYDNMNPVLAASLGSEETTLYKMVAAYAMFANGGTRVRPTLVDRVQDRSGKTIFAQDDRVCNDCAVRDLPTDQLPSIFVNRERVMDPITAYQLTSMMEGVVKRGTARSTVRLPVPIAGKTGTTNEAKDVWFVGFSNKIAAGCYMGYDTPKPLGRGAGGGSFCGPVFTQFMEEAIAKYGGSKFAVPEGGVFINIDRFSGARLPDGASGDHVVAEYFREGEEPIFGVTYDGGYAMGSDIPMFTRDGDPNDQGTAVTNSEGETVIIAPKASFGSLSSGGLY
ncbi:MAG: penicillin-binding protein 1A [Planktomarina sp.]